ncbi:MAG: hypothetical protein OJF47_002270 [Nitrospira sp.]|jgi:hypothetical protein|nr:MAG: hypothetical protein OJF47_002270 [Nitrospira sp.]
MDLGEVLSSLEPTDHYYGKVLEEIKRLSEERGVEFVSQAKEGWELANFVRPRKRTFFGIEDKKNKRAIVGMLLVPEPTREHSNLAWNRFEPPLREKLAKLEKNGHEGSAISCVLVQIWETEKRAIVIPLKDLDRVKSFRDTGDFRVKKDSGEFVLETPRWEDNIKLKSRLAELFAFI